MKLLMLKGLPASGKTTYAKELCGRGWFRVNKDDLRAMVHNGLWHVENEKYIVKWRNEIIYSSLGGLNDVVVDDTNFNPIHEKELRAIANAYKAEFDVLFFDTPLEECIERDSKRPNPVGEKVIRDMWEKYLK